MTMCSKVYGNHQVVKGKLHLTSGINLIVHLHVAKNAVLSYFSH